MPIDCTLAAIGRSKLEKIVGDKRCLDRPPDLKRCELRHQTAAMYRLLKLTLLAAVGAAPDSSCTDYDAVGCRTRAALPAFCDRTWAGTNCCATCSSQGVAAVSAAPAPTGCDVPRQKCVRWICDDGRTTAGVEQQPFGTTCRVASKDTDACLRCAVVDAASCAPWP